MKKIYMALMCLLCLLPLVGMTVAKTDATTEKRTLAPFPALTTEDGHLNTAFFSEFDEYFNDHFALRNLFVSADAMLMGRVFHTSNVDTVLVGRDGWLYYTATIDDYCGKNTMSERELFHTANNLALLQEYVQQQGSTFLFTVAPNKNTLYGAQMPRSYKPAQPQQRNLERLQPYLKQCGVNYAELRDLFDDPEHPLYFARDSHWNNRGALLVYNRLCDTLQLPHPTYADAVPEVDETYVGDLEQMLYPRFARVESNDVYDKYFSFSYGPRFQSVEDAIIESTGTGENASVLMYRDSFGNALIPFFANTFRSGYYVKTQPYNTALHMMTRQPTVVIAEKVERNLTDYIKTPPIIPAPVRNAAADAEAPDASTIEAAPVEANAGYFAICGTLDDTDAMSADAKVYVTLSDGKNTATFEAFGVTNEDGEDGYIAYFDRSAFPAASYDVTLLRGGTEVYACASTTVEIPAAEIDEING